MFARWSGAFQIAAVYVGTIVGAGFATGREIVEFFTRFGFSGFIGILIAGYLFIVIGAKIMVLSAKIGADSYEILNNYLFGERIARYINIIFLVMLLGVTSVMISGAGAVFEEQLGLPRNVGTLLTIFLAAAVLMAGIKGLFAVNSFVVPIMILFSIILCVLTVNGAGFHNALLGSNVHEAGWRAMVSPFSYAAFNLALAQVVLVPIANEVKDKRMIYRGAVLGGVFLTVILLTSHISLSTLTDVDQYSIPTAELMKNAASSLYWIFIFVIYGEIFTSVIGNLFGLGRQIQTYVKLPDPVIFIGIFLVTYFISIVEYGKLLSYLYPLFGYISLIFLALVWRKNWNHEG
ncbi:hypothetical protein D0469_03630 [Peribacillus saganii]|uniref:Transporter n=1 Tax=Peribacillus saganii TaxID=2303992 RepID=A0A372LS62_9BACI|nr:GerAB/ArcD/ProY family transporter [Peribacillus saganii]RFU71041.1 hypothetical protein D0469_03630 [Peribacillus saganii]